MANGKAHRTFIGRRWIFICEIFSGMRTKHYFLFLI